MCYVFFSYTRNDIGNKYLEKFHIDLANELRQKVGTIPSTVPAGEVVFLDTTDIVVGAPWKKELMNSLQSCKAFVCVYSPGYFNSEYCGKEFAVFKQRLESVSLENPPPLIFPVLWEINERVRMSIKIDLPGIQYTHSTFAEEYSEEGLCYLMRLQDIQYQKFLHHFAKTMASAIATYSRTPLPQLEMFPDLDKVETAWKDIKGPLPQPGEFAGLSGPGTTQFFFVAGSEAEYKQVRKEIACYNVRGGRFWSPYFPTPKDQVHHISYMATDALNANYVDDVVDNTLIDRILAAESNNTIVLLIVDPWSVKITSYRRLLEQCDGRAFLNCGLVIPWNDKDEEPEDARKTLRNEIKATFKRAFRLKHFVFRDSVQSADDLQKELSKVILEVRNRLMQETSEVRAAENSDAKASSTSSLPVVYGPGSNAA